MNVVEGCDLISLYIANCVVLVRKVAIAIYANVAYSKRENRPMLT